MIWLLIFSVVSLLINVFILALYVLSERSHRTEKCSSQVRHLDYLKTKDEDIRALTEALVRAEGKQLVFKRKPESPGVRVPGWMDQKPPESFIKVNP